jgi:ABC-type oligopeptide transport system substrate-binding subunit
MSLAEACEHYVAVLERNPRYHGRFSGNVQRVEMRLLEGTRTQQVEAYERDELDVVSILFLPPADLERVQQRHAGEYVSAPGLSVFFLSFDVTRPPFADVRVRRALAHAADRQAMVHRTGGHAIPATGGMVPPGLPGHSPGIALPYDPALARDLLAQAGYGPGGGPFPPVELWHPKGPAAADAARFVIGQWQQNLGLEIPGWSADWAEYLARLEKNPPRLWLMGWSADYPDPDSFLRTAISNYRRGWAGQPHEQLLQSARRMTDQVERLQLYRQVDRMVVGEALVMPWAYSNAHFLVKPWVKRCPLSNVAPPFFKEVVIEAHG